MTQPEFPYKQVNIFLNQKIYLWGKGWTISMEAYHEWEKEIRELITKLKMVIKKEKVVSNASDEGVNSIGESLYFHPMNFSGYIHQDNIESVLETIKSFKSKYWTYDHHNVRDMQSESNQCGWVGQIERNKKEFLVSQN
jgi:hypothetical protein